MATSFQAYIDRENIGNSVLKNNTSKTAQGQRGLSAKTLQAPTPRKALGDLGNIQHGTAKKFQTPKPSKVKIFDEPPKAKTSVKTKKATFSALKTQKGQNKIASDMKIPTKNENMLPDIEKMIPFVDQEKDLPRPECITKLLKHRGLLNPAIMVPPTTYQDNFKTPLHYELETFEPPLFDETMANIIGYDEKPELVEVDPHFALDFLPPLEDFDMSSFD